MVDAVFYGTAHDGVGQELAVGFRHDTSVDGSRGFGGGGAVVFDGFAHDADLFWREPSCEAAVGSEYSPSGDMVYGPRAFHAEVVVGGDDVCHVGVGSQPPREFQRGCDDVVDVAEGVGAVELCVARQDVLFDELHDL